ncbi:MAG: aminodeoxychorismate/anthranilate synthase component II [Arhodomonas sp.]|nr:aminodeoxychorismate/anthranilate synthase component II [Arhodomonas sp.]
MIDNYDSFTWNLVQYLGELGADVAVHRNDAVTVKDIEAMAPERIVISPGPCTPDQAGISLTVVRALRRASCRLLGVCLGHQAIGQAFGGRVVRASRVMHGKTSMIHHRGRGVFAGLPQPDGGHPLSLPGAGALQPSARASRITAWSEHDDGSMEEIMGVRHVSLDVEGVQFHPESILTTAGHDLLRNFLERPARAA